MSFRHDLNAVGLMPYIQFEKVCQATREPLEMCKARLQKLQVPLLGARRNGVKDALCKSHQGNLNLSTGCQRPVNRSQLPCAIFS